MKSYVDDIALLTALKDGDEQAFNALFSEFWDKIYAIAWHRLGDEQEADDVVQELFISVWERRKQIKLTGSFEQYLAGAVKFKIIDRIRSRTLKHKVFEELKHRMTEIEDEYRDQPDYAALDKSISEGLASLTDNVRAAFILRSENMTIREIAVQLNLKEQTVRNYIAEALQRMRMSIRHKYADDPVLGALILLSFVNDYLTK